MNLLKHVFAVSGIIALCTIAACGGSEPAPAAPEASTPAPTAAEPVVEAASEVAVTSEWPTTPLLDPNTVEASVLATVPGLDGDVVAAVIAARPFATPSEFDAALGDALDADTKRALYKLVFVKVELNNGDLADYELIPSSLSPGKLAHEFEEYRPYESMSDFTREMAKYVSEDEVAYLTRFVTIQ